MNPLLKCLYFFSLTVFIAACGGGGTDENTSDASSNTSNLISISGKVIDGPLVKAIVRLKNAKGAVISTTTSDQQAGYSMTAEVDSADFPLFLEASQGIDLVTDTIADFTLISIIPNRTVTHANLNPHSTLIVKTAQAMNGGTTDSNLEQARKVIIETLNFGIDTDQIDDPITTLLDSGNLPTITYASEALAEMIRRTEAVFGNQANAEMILNSLAADLTDGLLDGKGSAASNPRHTAVAQAVSLQVLLESMLQDLKVNGVSAEKKLNGAITTVLGTSNKPSTSYRSYYIKWLMFKQAKAALQAIQEIDPSVTLIDLMKVLQELGSEATTAEMIATLEQYGLDLSLSSTLYSSITLVANASDDEIDAIYHESDISESEAGDDETTTDSDEDNPITNVNDTIASDSTANQAPTISGTPTTSVAEGAAYVFTPSAADADGDTLSFSISNRPSWASFSTSSGSLTGTPSFNDAGTYSNIKISVSDGTDSAILDLFSISVTDTIVDTTPALSPGAPVLTSANLSGTTVLLVWKQDHALPDGGYDIFIDNIDTDTQYRTSRLSAMIPSIDTAVSHCFAIQARYTATNQFLLSNELCTEAIAPMNEAPIISGTPPSSVREGEYYNFTPSASDPNGDNLSFTVNNLPAWMSFNTSNGTLAGTPGYNHAGIYYDIAIKVSDGVNSASLNAFSISVQDSNRPPSINGTPATSVAEGAAYDFTPSAADADGDTLSFSISNRPSWASFNTSSGSLNGTPSFNDAGTYSNIKISVSDGTASTSLNPFSIYVSENNQTPRISGTPSTHGKEGQDYSFTPSATDADGDTLSFSVANLPAWAIFSNTDGTVSGTPGYSDAGNYHNIIISVSDGSATASLNAYSISVQDSNRVSSISGIPTTSVAEGEAYAFTPSASDPDGDTLTFNISNLPNWASFDTTSGSLTGTPGFNDAGIFSNIVISVSDGYDSVMLDPFNITVIDTKEDTIPELSPGAPILTSANVSDTSILLAWKQDHAIPDGGYDIFIDSVDTNTQYRTNQLSATIPEIDTAVSHCFAIKARYTDTSQFLVSNELCTDAIAPDNEAPIISGNPPKSVTADEIYNFTPTASDPDGDNLKFAVINLPGWMSFYVGNGTISGTPTGDDIGIYEDIIITVSDGTASSSLDAMSITVNPAPDIKGSANLTWHIPTTRTDGSLLNLSEINGFRIYRGDTKETLNMVLDLNNSSTKSHTVTDLTPGTHYFAVTVYDTQDNESDFSNIAKKTVP